MSDMENFLMKCIDCKGNKDPSAFNRNRTTKSGYQWVCRACQKLRHVDYQKRNPSKYRAGYYRRKYGLTEQQVLDMLRTQNNLCLICSNYLSEISNGLRKKQYQYDIDHCHETGKVRGILCHNCNVGLGRFQDKPDLLIKAAEYLNGRS